MSDDAQLVQAWMSGDNDAGARLVERHYDAVVRFFQTKAGRAADDLVQKTFLALAEARTRFRGESSFKSFLFGIARNVLFAHLRGMAKDKSRIDGDFGVSSIREFDPGVSTVAIHRAEKRLLVEGLQRLPVELQLALELYYWEELSVAELAQVLEIPPGTVKSRLHRGRQLLREAMEDLPGNAEHHASVRQLIDDWAHDVRGRHALG